MCGISRPRATISTHSQYTQHTHTHNTSVCVCVWHRRLYTFLDLIPSSNNSVSRPKCDEIPFVLCRKLQNVFCFQWIGSQFMHCTRRETFISCHTTEITNMHQIIAKCKRRLIITINGHWHVLCGRPLCWHYVLCSTVLPVVVWLSGSASVSTNKVTLCRVRLVLRWVTGPGFNSWCRKIYLNI